MSFTPGIHLAFGEAVFLGVQVEHVDLLADLLVDALPGLLPERALIHQPVEPARQFEMLVPRIVGEVLAHRVDHVREHVEADHVQRAERRALGTAEIAPGQRIHGIEAEVERLGVMLGGEHREYADAVGDEVGRVLGAHHALAQRGDEEFFQLIEQQRIGAGARDQLDQVHVARRVEEVDAAEAVAQVFREGCGERVDRQAGGVGRKDGLRAEVRRDLAVQVGFPVDALGDRLDHQVAFAQFFQVLLVVGRLDAGELGGAGQRAGLELLQAVERLVHVAVLVAFLRCPAGGKQERGATRRPFRWQFEQQRLDVGVDQVRRDLRAHHACAEHRDFADMEIIVHLISLRFTFRHILL